MIWLSFVITETHSEPITKILTLQIDIIVEAHHAKVIQKETVPNNSSRTS